MAIKVIIKRAILFINILCILDNVLGFLHILLLENNIT